MTGWFEDKLVEETGRPHALQTMAYHLMLLPFSVRAEVTPTGWEARVAGLNKAYSLT